MFAPPYHSLYALYSSSTPHPSPPDGTITTNYAFRFAELNCVAFYDFCTAHSITSYPSSLLYQDGELFETLKGSKNMTVLRDMIEGALEISKPGSRPKEVVLPAPGAKTSPPKAEPSDLAAAGKTASSKSKTGGKGYKAKTKKPAKGPATPNEEGI